MAEVKNNSSVNISRTQYSSSGVANTLNLGNKLFNGYVYSFSLDVGTDGNPTTLVLNLALDKTIKLTGRSRSVSEIRKESIDIIGRMTAAKQSATSAGNVQIKGNIGTFEMSGLDEDFDIKESYLGVNSSYSISILDGSGNINYQLKNFRIVSYSINKKDNQKLLSLILKDSSFVLSKIYVAVLGQEMALDQRSEISAIIDQIKISCPSINTAPGGQVTLKNFTQLLHFAEGKLAAELKKQYNNISKDVEILTDTTAGVSKKNYIIIQSKDQNKSVINGYGAVIILGEEDFKDGPCESAEMLYSFDTLLAAMERINISTIPAEYLSRSNATSFRTIKDKSNKRIKRNYRGNLREVLNQWCDEYAYSYCVSFSSESTSAASSLADTKILIKGIDLSSPTSKEEVVNTKKAIEALEASSQNDFVIKSQDFSYDLSQKILRLYSSYYFKEAKDKNYEYQNILREIQFYEISLQRMFPQLFADTSSSGKDFSGSQRSYQQVVISSVLGKYSPKLRQIYNCSIGAFQALGFLPMNTTMAASKITAIDDSRLIFQEAVTQALNVQADTFYDSTTSRVAYDMYFGFYNPNLASQIEKIENFIADFIGSHYWTDPVSITGGTIANENFSASYQVETSPPTQQIFADQIYKLEPFKQLNFLVNELASVFSVDGDYYRAFSSFYQLVAESNNVCRAANDAYIKSITDANVTKNVRYYYKRSAAYGVLQDLINDIQVLSYSFEGVNDVHQVDLSNIYAPIFKQLSPVSMGLLQSAIPVNISSIPTGHYKFGILMHFRDNIFSFNDKRMESAATTNPIEYQNYIRERCAILASAIAQGNENTKLANQRTCSKTILYLTCVQPKEQQQQQNNFSNQIDLISGPNPLYCYSFSINRKTPPAAILQANINKTIVSEQGFLTITPSPVGKVLVQGIRQKNVYYLANLGSNYVQSEFIVLPSQTPFTLKLISKTSQKIFMPYENYVKGGLEDPVDVSKIVNNDGFGVDIFVNNITPSVRELFGDQTAPSYVTNSFVQGTIDDGTPFIMDYVGYGDIPEGLYPKYQFLTFNQFHNALRDYYNDRSISYNQPAVSYSVEIFCASISNNLKSLLSVFNGLSRLNITFGEAGMTIQAEYKSYPAKVRNLESLVNRNRPNIKLINTNYSK